MNPLNVVYLHAHDAGRYIQPYGYGVPTPYLQKFAEQGMLFRQAFCANPTCSPSRACLMTGQYAHVNGMLGLAHRGFAMNDYSHTLVNHLRSHGWHTALSGIQHIAREPYASPSSIGYHEILDAGAEPAEGEGARRKYSDGPIGVTEAAEDFLARSHDAPFFLDVGYFPPHRGSNNSFPSLLPVPPAGYVRPPAHLPDTASTRQDFAEYMASVATFDLLAGRVLAALDRHNLAGNTLVIITTDHGIAFPGMKCRLTDHGLGVLFMLRGPGGFDGGKISDAMVSHIDVFPTVCELLGLPIPERVQGLSLLPLAEDPSVSLRDELFAEVNVHAAYEPMRAVRTTRWKYIRRLHDRIEPVLSNTDNGLAKTYLHERGWDGRATPEEELYDLVFDPVEGHNLAGDSAAAEVLKDMRSRLDAWMKETNDPFLNGGTLDLDDKIVTPSEAYSPSDR